MWDTNDESSIPKKLNINIEGKEYWIDYETYKKELEFMNGTFISDPIKPHESNIIQIIGRYITVPNETMLEDDLPEMTEEEYGIWFESSYVDFVRMGKKIILNK